MLEFFSTVNWEQMLTSIEQTLLMTLVPLVIAVVLGLLLGIVLYVTQKDGLWEHVVIFRILDFLVNVFRAIPFIILLFIHQLTLIILLYIFCLYIFIDLFFQINIQNKNK